MDLNAVLKEMESHPRIGEAGMILVHLGRVRAFDLEGRAVTSLHLEHDHDRAEAIRADLLDRPGVVEILIRLNSGHLSLGDPIMIAAVAGQTRQQVFPVLEELIDRLKKEAVRKREDLVEELV